MNGGTVADIVVGRKDSTGSEILAVYYKICATYAVYGTRDRVGIQFADAPALGAEQRKALTRLNPLPGQINGLIDGWRRSDGKKPFWLFFWRRADSKEIKADLIEERTSTARIDYVAIAALTATILILVACILTQSRYRSIYEYSPEGITLWRAFGAGALGALFSTGVAMRSRQILTDLQLRENRTDAIVRICIGAIAGVLLVAMLDAQIAKFSLGSGDISIPKSGDTRWLIVAFIAFVAGFSERLVTGLLDRATAAAATQPNPLAGSATGTSRSGGGGTISNETNPLGLQRPDGGAGNGGEGGAATPADDHEEGCLAEDEGNEEEATDDTQLPPATGGVEEPIATGVRS